MADEFNTRNTTTAMKTKDKNATAVAPSVETTTDRGLFDFVKNKKEDHGQQKEEEVMTNAADANEKKHDEGILGKLHRSGSNSSSSSSSSDEERDGDEKKKKKKKKSLTDKIKGHLPAKTGNVDEQKEEEKKKKIHQAEEVKYSSDHQDHQNTESAAPEKKGLFDKIKEKLPGHDDDTKTKKPQHENYDQKTAATPNYGHHDNHSEAALPHSTVPPPHSTAPGGVMEEKKGFFDKIKEKIPGFQSKTTDDDKRAEKVVKETEKRAKDYDSA